MLFDGVNPIDFHFIHDAIDQNDIFLRESGVIAPPWCDDT